MTSQHTEDRILKDLFDKIGVKHKQCVEFGAIDGIHLSNTFQFEKDGWKRVLFESDRSKCKGNVIHKKIEIDGENKLDNVLKEMVEQDFDLLSIDIDGDDYHVWESLKEFEPRVVIIEYNPTIPFDIEFVQPKGANQGTSLKSMVKLGREKGCIPVGLTDTNIIFVRNKEAMIDHILGRFKEGIKKINPDDYQDIKNKYQTRVFQLYDGTVKIIGTKQRFWHGGELIIK